MIIAQHARLLKDIMRYITTKIKAINIQQLLIAVLLVC